MPLEKSDDAIERFQVRLSQLAQPHVHGVLEPRTTKLPRDAFVVWNRPLVEMSVRRRVVIIAISI